MTAPLVASPAGFLVHDPVQLEMDRPDVLGALQGWCRENGIDPELVVAADPVRVYDDRIEYTTYVLASRRPKRLAVRDGDFVTRPVVHRRRPTVLPEVVLRF